MRQITALIVILFFSVTSAFSQGVVKGKVTDSKNGTPLAGISVKVKGTNIGTSTAVNGTFELPVSTAEVTLEFSGSDVISKETTANASDFVTISLVEDVKILSDVVVTGVGTATSKKKVPFDVATLSIKDAGKSVLGSVEQALQGKIAGAQIQFLSGTPGSSPIIILRTLNSLSYAPPLIMVDGVQVSSLDGIDLANVDRVEVVKGAAGGMLYGANGANGVIQIFTKKGANRKLQVDVLSQASTGSVIRDNEIIADRHSFQTDAQGYITAGGVRIAPNATGEWTTPTPLDDAADPFVMQNKPYKEQTYDHIAQVYKTASTFNNSITMSGGSDKTDYAFTLSRYDEQNVLENTFSRTSVSSNAGFVLAPGLTFRNITQVSFTDENLLSGDADASIGGTSTNRFAILKQDPYVNLDARDSTGHLVVFPMDDAADLNPLSEAEWRQRGSDATRIIENAGLHYKFPKFLELDYKYGIDNSSTDDHNYYLNQTTSLQANNAIWGNNVNGSIQNTYTSDMLQNSVFTAVLKTDFEKDFKLNFPLTTTSEFAYDYRREDVTQYAAIGAGLPTYPPYNISVATTLSANDYYSHFVTFGSLFTQSFDYKDLVGISGGVRSDYSSVFGEGHTPFTFPRGSIYFRPTSLVNMGPLTDWKLRATYAEAGIQPPVYSNISTLTTAPLGTQPTISYPSNAANPDLQVQVSKEMEIGTDAVFKTNLHDWLQRIVFSFSYWDRKGSNVLEYEDLPISTGFSTKLDNLVDLDARGFDFSLDADVLSTKDVDWQFGYRVGSGKTIATKIANGADIVQGIFKVKQGQELGLLDLQAPLTSVNQTRPDGTRYIPLGSVGNFQLVNGMVVDTASKHVQVTDPTDTKNAGSTVPKFISSFTNTFTIKKDLTISFQWDWVYGNKIYNETKQWLYADNTRLSADFDKSVTINGVTGPFVAYYSSLYNTLAPLSYFVEDGSYWRLRDLSVTYNFSDALHLKWTRDLSLTFSGRNLITITKYSGLDPESTTTADSEGNEARGTGLNTEAVGAVKPSFAAALYGVDYFAVPNLRSYQVSLRVGF
jgi:TonB-linked SusC/RagA family outer membrane protein